MRGKYRGQNFNLHKSNDFVDKIVRFVYDIIEKKGYLFKMINSCYLRKGTMICLLPQLN